MRTKRRNEATKSKASALHCVADPAFPPCDGVNSSLALFYFSCATRRFGDLQLPCLFIVFLPVFAKRTSQCKSHYNIACPLIIANRLSTAKIFQKNIICLKILPLKIIFKFYIFKSLSNILLYVLFLLLFVLSLLLLIVFNNYCRRVYNHHYCDWKCQMRNIVSLRGRRMLAVVHSKVYP